LAYLRDRQDEMVALLTELVEMESPTDDKASLDRLAAFLAAMLRSLA
jgi:acetylornithine deacetylase/succinyl-diaminopimelate desuccinylase-like protein